MIGGAGALVMAAKSDETFADAVPNKLVREIAGRDTPAPQRSIMTQAADGVHTAAESGGRSSKNSPTARYSRAPAPDVS